VVGVSAATQLFADDAGFVRAPVALVYRRLTHMGAWPSWWDGVRVRALPDVDGDEVWAIEFRGARARRVRVAARCHGWRFNGGFTQTLRGDLEGRSEFWLEPTHGGTVVHHVLVATSPVARPTSVLADHRRAVRRGLWGLKEALELEVRTAVGLTA
jgi:hypothetical protein